jgi:hypothetical protein
VAAPLSVHPSGLPAHPDASASPARLQAFRAELHACCSRRADALVDLADALLSVPGPVASLPQLEPGTGPPARLGQSVCRAGVRTDRRPAAVGPARPLPLGRWPAGLRGGRDHLAALRRRVLARARPVLPPLQAFGGPADRRRLGVGSGSASSAWTATPGPRRWMPGCIPWTTPTTPRPCRSARCLGGCRLAGRCRGLCSTPATTPRSCRWTWPKRPLWCWCGCAQIAASTPTRHHAHPAPGGRPRRHGAKFAFADPATWPNRPRPR